MENIITGGFKKINLSPKETTESNACNLGIPGLDISMLTPMLKDMLLGRNIEIYLKLHSFFKEEGDSFDLKEKITDKIATLAKELIHK